MNLEDVLSDTPPPIKPDRAEVMQKANEELAAFEAFFSAPISEGGAGNSPMVPSEKALIRTYLVARIAGLFPSPLDAQDTSQA